MIESDMDLELDNLLEQTKKELAEIEKGPKQYLNYDEMPYARKMRDMTEDEQDEYILDTSGPVVETEGSEVMDQIPEIAEEMKEED